MLFVRRRGDGGDIKAAKWVEARTAWMMWIVARRTHCLASLQTGCLGWVGSTADALSRVPTNAVFGVGG
ncbi:MAG: hypothetical protein LCI00_09375 [Chloroflexi bacterium]|nr:hypothetical protein [Chloroflexota bacterium]